MGETGVRSQPCMPWTRSQIWLIAYLSFMASQKMVAAVACGSFNPSVEVGTDSALLNAVLLDWEANGCSGTIVFTSNGATLRLSREVELNNDLTLDASGLASGVTLLAAPASRHFWTTSSTLLQAFKVTFSGGRPKSLVSDAYGGSIYIYGSIGRFYSCTFTNNTVTSTNSAGGGAIYISSGTSIEMFDCTVRDNAVVGSVEATGGGVAVSDSWGLTLTGTTFLRNSVQSPVSARGGGVYVGYLSDSLVIESSSFSHNKVMGRGYARGGGLDAFNAVAHIRNCSFSFNQVLSTLVQTARNSMDLRGGGLAHAGSLFNMTSTLVTGNFVGPLNSSYAVPEVGYGAGVYTWADFFRGASLTVRGNSLQAYTGSGAGLCGTPYSFAAGSYFLTSSTVESNVFKASMEAFGGGLCMTVPGFMLRDVMIRNNTIRFLTGGTDAATGHGAGVAMWDNSRMGVMTRVTVTSNSLVADRNGEVNAYGGGVAWRNFKVVLQSCTITGNQILVTGPLGVLLNGHGGGLACYSGLTLRNSVVSNNAVRVQGGGTSNTAKGGGVCVWGAYEVSGSTLSGNVLMSTGTTEGGALCALQPEKSSISNSILRDNSIVGDGWVLGGGLSSRGQAVEMSNVEVLNNSITLNHTRSAGGGVGHGAGAFLDGGRFAVLRGCTISGNKIALATKHGLTSLTINGAGVSVDLNMTLIACLVSSNVISIKPTASVLVTARGAGISQGGQNLVVRASTLRNNRIVLEGSCQQGSVAEGGGLAAFVSPTITDTSIVGNRVTSLLSAQGGGLFVYATSTPFLLQRCNISANLVNVTGQAGFVSWIYARGGGVFLGSGQTTLERCNVTSNLVTAQGASVSQPVAAGGGGIAAANGAIASMSGVWLGDNMARQLAPALAIADTYARGGGVLVSDAASLSATVAPLSVFTNNRVQSATSLAGGAAFAPSAAALPLTAVRVVDFTATWPANTVVNSIFVGPTTSPTLTPTSVTSPPTIAPTTPTVQPTMTPTPLPTKLPTTTPTPAPTTHPTLLPTDRPTVLPSVAPTLLPTVAQQAPPPTPAPANAPSLAPTLPPGMVPAPAPTLPTTFAPTPLLPAYPTLYPTAGTTTAPSLAPSIAPTAATNPPTLPPSSSPSVSPTMAPLPVLITVLSQRQPVQGGGWLVDVDSPLQLYGGDGLLGSVSLSYTWHSPNSTAPACLLSSGPYLTVRPGCLRAGALYAFRVTVTSAQGQTGTQQVVVSGNSPPSNGTCLTSPHTGMALSTRFTVRCVWWADAEGHYPLSYQFSAHTPTRHVALSTATNTSTIATVLPEGSNLSVVTTVRDVYGASTVAATRNLTASPLTLASLTSLLQHTASRVDAATVLNETVFYEALLVVTEGAALHPSLQTNTTTGVLLGVLERLSLSRVVLDGSTAAGLAGCLELLTAPLASATAPLPTSLTMARVNSSLAIASVLASRSTAAHDGLSTSLVTTISHVIAAGALGTDASTSLSAGAASQIQDVIHSLTQAYATTMTPGSDDQTFQSPHIAFSVGVSLLDGATPVVMSSPAAQETSLNISTGAAAELATALDTPMIVRKAIQWSLNGQANSAEALSVSGDASSTPRLLSNLSTWEIGTIKNGTLQRASVSGLSSPLILSQRSNRVAQRYAAPPVQQRCPNCPDTYQALCHYTTSSATGWNNNSSRSIECHSSGGTSSCQCPLQDRCAFWEKATRQWSSRGCRMLGSADDEAVTRCSCDHLTTFAVLADTAAFVVATAAMGESLNRETLQKSLGLVVFLAALYAAFLGGLVLIRYRRTRESLAYLKRVPQTRMFVTVTSALLGNYRRRADALLEVTGNTRKAAGSSPLADDARSLDAVVESVVGRRRRKLEGLRAYLRSYMPGRRLLGTGTGTVYADTSDKASDTYRTPITKLTQQQAYLKAFITVATQLVLSIVVTGPNPPPIKEYLLSITGVHLDSTAVYLLISTTVQQCIVTEPVTRILDILFYAINKETSVQKSVSELIVDRDLPLAVPHSAAQAGRRYVPLLRISLLQLEMIDRVVQDGTAIQPSTNKILDEADTLTMATRRLLLDPKEARVVHRTLSSRVSEFRRLLYEEFLEAKKQAWEQTTHGGMLSTKPSVSSASSSPLMMFRANPLEVFEVEARMSRDYDQWVMTALYHRRFRDWAKRTYYQLFVADPSEHVMTQERFLFSWRLLLIDGVLLAYMLLITFIALLLGLNATINIVGFALFSMVTGVIGNVFVLSPLVTIIQGRFTHRLLLAITDDVAKSQDTFRQQYERNANKRHDEDPVVPLSLYADEDAARALIQKGRLSKRDPLAVLQEEEPIEPPQGLLTETQAGAVDISSDTIMSFSNGEDNENGQTYRRNESWASDVQADEDEEEQSMAEAEDDEENRSEARDNSNEEEEEQEYEEEDEEEEEEDEDGDEPVRSTTTRRRPTRRAR